MRKACVVLVSVLLVAFVGFYGVVEADTYTVTNTDDSGEGSLRWAIEQANANPGLDNIEFNISGEGPHTIQPNSYLPGITDPVVIDGYTQPGAQANTNPISQGLNTVLKIELDGSNLGQIDAFVVYEGGSGSTIRGLIITGWGQHGLQLHYSEDNLIAGNFIIGNLRSGVLIYSASGNRIGGTTPEAANLISGNIGEGGVLIGSIISLYGPVNVIQGNLIGTDVSGSGDMGNSGYGVVLGLGGVCFIGGESAEMGNIIAYNHQDGVSVLESGNQIRSNSIFSNGELGIDLGGNGLHPELAILHILDMAISTGAGITVYGSITQGHRPNAQYNLDFFSNSETDPTGYGEGETFLGNMEVVTNDIGYASFTFNSPIQVPEGYFISATVTQPDSTTSEFCECVEVIALEFDIEISYISVGSPASVGWPLQGKITVSNHGPDDAVGITLSYAIVDESGDTLDGYPQETDPLDIPVIGDTAYDFEWTPEAVGQYYFTATYEGQDTHAENNTLTTLSPVTVYPENTGNLGYADPYAERSTESLDVGTGIGVVYTMPGGGGAAKAAQGDGMQMSMEHIDVHSYGPPGTVFRAHVHNAIDVGEATIDVGEATIEPFDVLVPQDQQGTLRIDLTGRPDAGNLRGLESGAMYWVFLEAYEDGIEVGTVAYGPPGTVFYQANLYYDVQYGPPGTVFHYEEAAQCWDMEVGLNWGTDIEVSHIGIGSPASVGWPLQGKITVSNVGANDAEGVVVSFAVLDDQGSPLEGYPQQSDPLAIPIIGDNAHEFTWTPEAVGQYYFTATYEGQDTHAENNTLTTLSPVTVYPENTGNLGYADPYAERSTESLDVGTGIGVVYTMPGGGGAAKLAQGDGMQMSMEHIDVHSYGPPGTVFRAHVHNAIDVGEATIDVGEATIEPFDVVVPQDHQGTLRIDLTGRPDAANLRGLESGAMYWVFLEAYEDAIEVGTAAYGPPGTVFYQANLYYDVQYGPPGTVFHYEEAAQCWDMELGLYWGQEADLEVTQIVPSSPLSVGYACSVSVKVYNHGPDDAEGITVSLAILNELLIPIMVYPSDTLIIFANGDADYGFEWTPEESGQYYMQAFYPGGDEDPSNDTLTVGPIEVYEEGTGFIGLIDPFGQWYITSLDAGTGTAMRFTIPDEMTGGAALTSIVIGLLQGVAPPDVTIAIYGPGTNDFTPGNPLAVDIADGDSLHPLGEGYYMIDLTELSCCAPSGITGLEPGQDVWVILRFDQALEMNQGDFLPGLDVENRSFLYTPGLPRLKAVRADTLIPLEKSWKELIGLDFVLGCSGGELGDVNGDSAINVLDVLAVVNHILDIQILDEDGQCRADCNGDDVVNILDALSIVNVILGIFTECPGKACKPEVTPEVLEFLKGLEPYFSAEEFTRFMAMVKAEAGIPTEYSLSQNYPNPFNPSTDIRYQISDSRSPVHTTLKVYNILGQEVRMLVDEVKEPGYYTVTWDASEMPSGVYFYRLQAGDFTATKKMVLLK